mmetsp:Transcript_72609/g.206787  ORF Transcript_72609/g.206787 Transcript_72609/m.206787 type:complete len:214 (-) Transcript_72609:813-1454(-)
MRQSRLRTARSVGVAMERLLRVLARLLFIQHSLGPCSLSAAGVEVPIPLFINSKGLRRESYLSCQQPTTPRPWPPRTNITMTHRYGHRHDQLHEYTCSNRAAIRHRGRPHHAEAEGEAIRSSALAQHGRPVRVQGPGLCGEHFAYAHGESRKASPRGARPEREGSGRERLEVGRKTRAATTAANNPTSGVSTVVVYAIDASEPCSHSGRIRLL